MFFKHNQEKLKAPFILCQCFRKFVIYKEKGIFHPVVSVSVLAWIIRYIFYRHLQYLNQVIIIKT